MSNSTLKQGMVLFAVAVAAAFVYNAFSPRGIRLVGQWDTQKGVISAGEKNAPVVHELEIDSVVAAKRAYDTGALFVDARSPAAYREGHVRGAVLFPVYAVEEHLEAFLARVPTDRYLITYCTGRECEDSHELAQVLLSLGYEKVSVFIDGYPAWEDAGFPVAP